MDNLLSEFNETFFHTIKGITWFDKDGIMEMDKTRNVVITLDDISTREMYVGYWVRIYNKNQGLIVEKFFRFQHFLEFKHRSEREKYSHVWYSENNLDWYISKPYSTKPMVDSIMDYIGKWK